jgi:hypothetical protein
MPDLLKFTAAAEPLQDRRERFICGNGIAREKAFPDWRDLRDRPRLADAVMTMPPPC